ncbi:MAG: hypothetical protein IT423_01600 [Pirellulaceae bacterium]|nr:hypothetical protein [Pirellulaceae bacterium]
MSYIDTFDNEFVGYFGGIPVYHPLEVVPATPDCPEDFSCGPENLVVGGGSGEHPGIVVKEPGEAVVCFARAWLSEENPFLTPELRAAIQPAIAAWPDGDMQHTWHEALRRKWKHVFEFAGWRVEDYVEFSNRCQSPGFPRPFHPDQDYHLEHWLAASVGEFILFAMPELAQAAIQRLGDLRQYLSGTLYKNILLLPPGYQPWGRREIDQHVTWGVSAWRIQREQNPQTIRDNEKGV